MDYNFLKKGEGEKILMVHGWGGSIESLIPLYEILSKNYEVYALELPGHGKTFTPERPWETSDFVNFVKSFIEKNNLKDFTYIGHSFGGNIGMRISLEENSPIKKLILISSSGIKPNNSLKLTFWKILSQIFKPIASLNIFQGIRQFVYKYIIRERDYAKTSGTLRETFQRIVKDYLDEKIQLINQPTLIVWGKDDKITPLWMGQKLNNGIKNSEIKVIEGRHGIPFTFPQVVGEIILNWMSK